MGKYDRNKINQDPDELKRLIFAQVIRAEDKANRNVWVSCSGCYSVFEKYSEIDVKGLAEDTGMSDDTIYDRAHAYEIFRDICELDQISKNGKFVPGPWRQLAFYARRSQYIKWSHFRALWDARKTYNLTMYQIADLLWDIVYAEGSISSRGVDGHVQGKYGVDRGWEWYIERASFSMEKAIQDPKLPNAKRDAIQKFLSEMT